jgi:hypothetical protein
VRDIKVSVIIIRNATASTKIDSAREKPGSALTTVRATCECLFRSDGWSNHVSVAMEVSAAPTETDRSVMGP